MERKFPTLSITQETYGKIRTLAREEHRTLSGQILFLLENYLKNRPDEKKEVQ
jgi:hypothetical protein